MIGSQNYVASSLLPTVARWHGAVQTKASAATAQPWWAQTAPYLFAKRNIIPASHAERPARHPGHLVGPRHELAAPAAELAVPVVELAVPATELAAPAAELAAPAAKLALPAAELALPVAKLAAPTAKLAAPASKLAVPAAELAAPVSKQAGGAPRPGHLARSSAYRNASIGGHATTPRPEGWPFHLQETGPACLPRMPTGLTPLGLPRAQGVMASTADIEQSHPSLNFT